MNSKEYQADYYQKHKAQILSRHSAYAQGHKEQARKYAQNYYQNNKEKLQAYDRTYLQRLSRRERIHLNKVVVLSHYSNPQGNPSCNNCGEQDIDVLCVDHIKGGGHKHFIEIGRWGSTFHKWLIKNNFPEGYQTLCYNCNHKKELFKS